MKIITLTLALAAVAPPAFAQHDGHQQQAQTQAQTPPDPRAQPVTPPTKMKDSLPPGTDDFIKLALEKSPRHHEWVDIRMGNGMPVKSFVVFPETKSRVGVVIVVHENRGLNDWARAVADQLAEDGFIAIAPDLLSGKGPNGGNTDSIPPDQATRAIGQLTADEVNARLDTVREYAIQMPAGNGRVGMVGFCWGGGRTFAYAMHRQGLDAAVVYYGPAPSDAAQLDRIETPVLAFYGENDLRVNQTIKGAEDVLNKDGRKRYTYHIYRGAGHAFLRQQYRSRYDLEAAERAWPLTIRFFKDRLK